MCYLSPHFLGSRYRQVLQLGDSVFRRKFPQQPFLAFWVSNITFENSWAKFHLVPDPHRPPLHCVQCEGKGSWGRNTGQYVSWSSDYSCFETRHPEFRFYCFCFKYCFFFKLLNDFMDLYIFGFFVFFFLFTCATFLFLFYLFFQVIPSMKRNPGHS